jgi:hypothetical protein
MERDRALRCLLGHLDRRPRLKTRFLYEILVIVRLDWAIQ